MKKDYTHITYVLDRSGSMASVLEATIKGFNSLLEDQKKVTGEATFTLLKFDDKFEYEYNNVKLSEVKGLDANSYIPRGSTALLDASVRAINSTGEFLSNLKEEDRPENVVFVIQTDGEENSSREFTYLQLADKIKHQQEKYAWKFIFLGSNQDAIATAAKFNIGAGTTLSYASNTKGTAEAYASTSSVLRGIRANNVAVSFSDKDRSDQKASGAI